MVVLQFPKCGCLMPPQGSEDECDNRDEHNEPGEVPWQKRVKTLMQQSADAQLSVVMELISVNTFSMENRLLSRKPNFIL